MTTDSGHDITDVIKLLVDSVIYCKHRLERYGDKEAVKSIKIVLEEVQKRLKRVKERGRQ